MTHFCHTCWSFRAPRTLHSSRHNNHTSQQLTHHSKVNFTVISPSSVALPTPLKKSAYMMQKGEWGQRHQKQAENAASCRCSIHGESVKCSQTLKAPQNVPWAACKPITCSALRALCEEMTKQPQPGAKHAETASNCSVIANLGCNKS